MLTQRSSEISRRNFLTTSLVAVMGSLAAAESRPRRIVLRSSWQTVNIGDIAHTPGVLALLEKHLPEVEVRLWPSSVGNGVAEMLLARFPKLHIIQTPESLKTAFDECDFLLHGSGPSLVAAQDIAKWRDATGKPYGVYGITFNAPDTATAKPEAVKKFEQSIPIMSGARFVFFRDSVSLAEAKKRGCTCPVMGFGPDGAFATDLRDDAYDRIRGQSESTVDQCRACDGASLAAEAVLQLDFTGSHRAQNAAALDLYAELRKSHVGWRQVAAA